LYLKQWQAVSGESFSGNVAALIPFPTSFTRARITEFGPKKCSRRRKSADKFLINIRRKNLKHSTLLAAWIHWL